jgi:hypothetical protein
MSRDRGAEEPTGPFDFSDMNRQHEDGMRHLQAALDALREAFDAMPPITVQRGGIRYGEYQYPKRDPRQGEEVYVYDILPGARVYVLEDVFTVDRVDMNGTLPTVWLKELPTSPLYFTNEESIYLANETED